MNSADGDDVLIKGIMTMGRVVIVVIIVMVTAMVTVLVRVVVQQWQ